MRGQINALPEGQVKSQMGKALNVLERELGMEIETNEPSIPQPAQSWELQILHGPDGKGRVVLKVGATFLLSTWCFSRPTLEDRLLIHYFLLMLLVHVRISGLTGQCSS